MPVIATEGSTATFAPAPEGTHRAVCVDVVDKPNQETRWGVKDKVSLAFEIDEIRPEAEDRFLVWSTFTVSLHEKSRLRPFLEAWRGKRFTKEELQGFDLENLLDVPCTIQVIHNESGDNTYANISSIMPAQAGAGLAPSGDWVRMQDRDEGKEVGNDDVPF